MKKMTKQEAGIIGYEKAKERMQSHNQAQKKLAMMKYEQNPKYCPNCDTMLPYELRVNKFCNSSCSAQYSNKLRAAPPHECLYPDCKIMVPAWKQHGYCCRKHYLADAERRRMKKFNAGLSSHCEAKRCLLDIHGNICMDLDCIWDMKKRPIKVEMDHINGINYDNRPENLRLLCPNCHSLTHTYRAKNTGAYK